MLALIAAAIALIAWAVHVLGGGLTDPWAWVFAVLAFIGAHLAFAPWVSFGPWRHGRT